MNTIQAKISFTDDARPFADYENLTLSFPLGVLPNIGDAISIKDLKSPKPQKGGFFVILRDFSQTDNYTFEVTLHLGFEDELHTC